MYISTDIYNFERTLHQFATSYEDLLSYQTEGDSFLNGEVLTQNSGLYTEYRNRWNREFIHKQYFLTTSDLFLQDWFSGLSNFSGLEFQNNSGFLLLQNSGEFLIFPTGNQEIQYYAGSDLFKAGSQNINAGIDF